ncbi:MAG: hypothetical protein IAE97_03280 [Chthoniobacterales bacterium]|nr:hypothetical protein [Chthoniobacterales bacterium]
MKTLSENDILSLVGARPDDRHPLEIIGYDFTSEGVRRFREEKPNFLPQMKKHIQESLLASGIFPQDTNPEDPGWRAFIQRSGSQYKMSWVAEVGTSRFDRFSTDHKSIDAAIHDYLLEVCNPDYVPIDKKQNANEPVHLIPSLRDFWHFACGAGSDARSKRDR